MLIEGLQPHGARLPVKGDTRFPIPIMHLWQPISNDASCLDLEEMVLESSKHVRVELGQVVQRHPTNLPDQLHLKEVEEHEHAGSDVEEWNT